MPGGRPALSARPRHVGDVGGQRAQDLRPRRPRAGEEKRVELSVPVAELTLVDADGVRVVEPGDVEILVGPDSSDARLLASTVTVTA